jgi:2-haloacid dehalogenase
VTRAGASSPDGRASRPGPVEAVVFDLGGVCIDWDPRHLYRKLFAGDDEAMERFLAEVCSPEWNAELDGGRSWTEAIDTLSREHPESRALIEAFRERWVEMLGGPIHDTVAILDRLHRAGTPTYALSNWSAETFPIARPLFPFLEWFDGVVISGGEGIRKPDPRIFRVLLERYGLAAAATAFVDDVAENVAAAEAVGMVGILFRDGHALRADLRGLGLLGG